MRVKKEELGDWRKNGSEDRDTVQMQLPPHEVRCELDEYEGEEQQLAEKVHGCLKKQPHP